MLISSSITCTLYFSFSVSSNPKAKRMQHAKGMKTLELHVFVLGDKAVFEVLDDGCGIEKERMKGLFQDYFSVKDAPVDNQKRSMGIGLAVCASIIKAHGGKYFVHYTDRQRWCETG